MADKKKVAAFDFSGEKSSQLSVDWLTGKTEKAGWMRRNVHLSSLNLDVSAGITTIVTKEGEPRAHMSLVIDKWTDGDKAANLQALVDNVVDYLAEQSGSDIEASRKSFNVSPYKKEAKASAADSESIKELAAADGTPVAGI